MTWPTTSSYISWASTSLRRTGRAAHRPGCIPSAPGSAPGEKSSNAGSVTQSKREEQHRPRYAPPITPGLHLGVADLPVGRIELGHRYLAHLESAPAGLPEQIRLQ